MPTWTKQLEDLIAGRRRALLINGPCVAAMQDMPQGFVGACAVDPPYGVAWCGVESKQKPIANDQRPYIWFLHELHRVLKPSAAVACFHVERLQQEWKTAIELAGFRVHNQFIWDKGRPGMGDTERSFAPCDERAWIASKGRWRLPNGRPNNVLRHSMIPPRQRHHSTEKPVEVMSYLIRHLAHQGDIIIDPTMGSGSTGVAALREGYRFIGIELDPENYNIARMRINREINGLGPVKAKAIRAPHYCLA